jgi:(R,R)-butanediol dehydrogenase/meso-butanediol dehydrogenase/diacetyl reductase
MRAVRWHGSRDVRLEEVELELPLGPEMVEVEVAYCGICGSDVSEYVHPFAIREIEHPLSGQQPPVTLGHEFSGRVVAVGAEVTGISPGDRVSADACWRCGECAACLAGDYNRCLKSGSIGLCSDGAFADRLRFPAYCVVPLPEAVGDREGALLEPLAVGLHALERGGLSAGDPVVVLGFGPIGAAAALIGAALGMEVLVSEPAAGRRTMAASLGLATIEPLEEPRELSRRVRQMTGGGAAAVIDASGAAAALAVAPEMARRGGRVVLVGIPKRPVEIDGARLVLYERSLVGSLGYVADLPRVADLIAEGRLDVDPLISREIVLEQVPAELARLADHPGDEIKVVAKVGG